jgi:hypothetical protein
VSIRNSPPVKSTHLFIFLIKSDIASQRRGMYDSFILKIFKTLSKLYFGMFSKSFLTMKMSLDLNELRVSGRNFAT